MNRHPQRTGRLRGRLTALLLLLVSAPLLQAQEYGPLEKVEVSPSLHGPQIRISFNRPAQYLGHSPKSSGRQLFIDLRLVGAASGEPQVPQEQQLRLKPGSGVPLDTVEYRAQGRDTGRLELNFRQTVRYMVTASADFRGLTITLIREGEALPATPPEAMASPAVEKRVNAWMEQARLAMIDERDFARAVTLYQQVLGEPANSRQREALELLGLARERLGQYAQAKAVYEQYLERYPQGEASERVRQRRMSLITAALPDRERLRDSQAEASAWEVYSSFSQFYLRDSFQVDGESMVTTGSAISSDVDVVAQRRGESSDSRLRLTAGHYYDLLDEANGNEARVSSLYAEHHDHARGWWARGGRQTSYSDGTLGRYDGLKLGYELGDALEASIVAGYPVDSSLDPIDDSRQFAGLALDFGPFADSWEFTLYSMEQESGALLDRRAVGGELRYFRPELMVLGLVDYDLFYDELNIGMLLANWTLANQLTLNATLDQRKSPTLTTHNALQGQPVEELESLRSLFNDDTIYQLARDRTAETRTLTLGASYPYHERLRLLTDLTVMETSATVSSGGVIGLPATGNEYFLNLQMIGNGVLNGDDISSLGLRLSNTATARSAGLYASSRLGAGDWHYYPRLQLDQRQWKTNDLRQWNVSPVLRVEYRHDRFSFESELGVDWSSRELPDDTERTTGLYGSIGYRIEF